MYRSDPSDAESLLQTTTMTSTTATITRTAAAITRGTAMMTAGPRTMTATQRATMQRCRIMVGTTGELEEDDSVFSASYKQNTCYLIGVARYLKSRCDTYRDTWVTIRYVSRYFIDD